MHLTYPKLHISLRNTRPWNRKQYLWPLNWTDGWALRLEVPAAETGVEMIGSHHLFPESTPWVSSQRSASPLLSVKKRCSGWRFAPAHNVSPAQSETEERTGSRRKWGPILAFINYLRVLNVCTEKNVFKLVIKIHLRANQGLRDIPSKASKNESRVINHFWNNRYVFICIFIIYMWSKFNLFVIIFIVLSPGFIFISTSVKHVR